MRTDVGPLLGRRARARDEASTTLTPVPARAGRTVARSLRGRWGPGIRWPAEGWADDSGSAVVEFCLLAVLMLVPVVYLVLALGRVQAGAFAAQGAAREAGRAFVTAQDEGSARGRADAAAAIAFADQGFRDPSQVGIDIGCAASPCLAPDQRVTVRSRVLVVLPGVPRLLDRLLPARLEVTARHVATVDRFRGRESGGEP
jgi:Flp pilus assembly pilin Flp